MRVAIAIAALALVLPLSAQAEAPPPAPPVPQQARQLFTDFARDNHVPGLVYAVVTPEGVSLLGTHGVQDLTSRRPVTADTMFGIASMTKAFTVLAILKLRDDGKLGLDDLAETHVPEMRGWTSPTSDSPRIRVRDLIHHVGGLVTDDPWGDRHQPISEAEFTAMIAAGVPFSRPTQLRHEYSNYGYALLGRIVAAASGLRYQDYVQQTLLTPLGMTSSGFEVADMPLERRAIGYRWENGAWTVEPNMADGAFSAIGGLQVSAHDYAKWIRFLLSAWPARDGPDTGPVRRSTVREMAQGLNFVTVAQRIGTSGPAACRQAAAYAMGWRVAQDCELGLTLAHGGGYPGYGSHVMLMPDYGVGVFALTNRTYAGPSAPAWDTAVALHRAGMLTRAEEPVSAAATAAHDAALRAFGAGNLAPLDGMLAMNFLMDRTAANWARYLGEIKAEVGACRADTPPRADGALAANFRWTCDRGEVDGRVLLAPTTPATIQAWRLRVIAPRSQSKTD